MYRHSLSKTHEAPIGGRASPLLRAPAAAAYIGLSASTLAKMRVRGDGPPYSKAGPRVVVYNVADLDTWLVGKRRQSTSDTGEAA